MSVAPERDSSRYRQGNDVFVLAGATREAMRTLRDTKTVAVDSIPPDALADLERKGVPYRARMRSHRVR